MIAARSLAKHYGKTIAVSDLSFEVAPGAVTGFLGPNGSGKSTTMRMIMGLDNPTAGSALVNGVPYRELRWPLREVGALLDAKAFHPGRSAYNHLLCLSETNDIPRRRIDDVLDIVGLTSVAHDRAGRYSLGMGQRLGIAAALRARELDPSCEFTVVVDPEGIRWVRYLLRDLAAEGRTVFVSSHLINEMSLTAERLIVIGRGSLIAETSVQEFTARSAGGSVRVVTPMSQTFVSALSGAGAGVTVDDDGAIVVTGMTSAQVGDLAAHRSLTVHELVPLRASLEDVFMELTRDSVEFHTHDASRHTAAMATSGTKGGS